MSRDRWMLALSLLAVLILCACQPVRVPTPAATVIPATAIPPTAVPPVETATPAQDETAQMDMGTFVTDEIVSNALAANLVGDPAERPLAVHLPPGYEESDTRYPVVYVLHWFAGDHYTGQSIILPYLDMLAEGAAHEMILVFPHADNVFGGSQYLSSPTIGDYETYIAEEVVNHMDTHYRTIPHRDSRAITGCSMGGGGSIRLALTYPDVFSVTVPMSAKYDYANDPTIPVGSAGFVRVPEEFSDLQWLPLTTRTYIAVAAAAAPNPDAPPFYLDMPFELVDGKGQVVLEVWEKIVAVDAVHDVEGYLAQPERLNGILLYHGRYDTSSPVEPARSFDELLTDNDIAHEYLEVTGGHCDMDIKPVVAYLSQHLAFEK